MRNIELVRDFVNTFDVESQTDSLATRADLTRWLRAHRLAGPATLSDAIAVREALRELLLANNHLPADVEGASALLDRSARAAGLRVRFRPGGAEVAGRGGLGGLLAAAADAMGSPEWPRLKACRAETCHWAFVDTARNRSRAWCSMRVCGNRQKARRYRERRADAN
jgi:predicted RNA-binding Zn ribbon-like protein